MSELKFLQITTPTLEPSLIGFKTNFFLEIILLRSDIFLITLNSGVFILAFINIFLDFSLSIAIAEDLTPECV